MPPAMSATRRRVRRSAVKVPYGPSAKPVCPAGGVVARRVSSPRSFTVMRRNRLFGAADSENGWAFAQPVSGQEPPQEELPGLGADAVEVRPAM